MRDSFVPLLKCLKSNPVGLVKLSILIWYAQIINTWLRESASIPVMAQPICSVMVNKCVTVPASRSLSCGLERKCITYFRCQKDNTV